MAVTSVEIPGNRKDRGQFEGYGNPNFVMLPRIFIRHQMQDLTEAELKVMLYIFDHTWGYTDGEGNRKDADAISRSQFLNGIRRLDGTQIDRGAGVSDRSLDRALDSLVKRGYIFRHHRTAANGRSDTNIYELNRYGQPSIKSAQNSQRVIQTGQSGAEPQTTVVEVSSQTNKDYSDAVLKEQKYEPNSGSIHPRKFTPLHQSVVEEAAPTPANLRPYNPTNLRPSTPANLRDTKENPNKQKIKQHTTTAKPDMAVSATQPGSTATDTRFLADSQGARGNIETEMEEGSRKEKGVCVSVSFSTKEFEEHLLNSQPFSRSDKTSRQTGKDQNQSFGTQPGLKPTGAVEKGPAPEQVVLTQDLLKAGVSQKEAALLATLAHQNGHPEIYVKLVLDYIDRQRAVHNREGLLIHLIKTNWQPPVAQEQTGTSGGQPTAAVLAPLPPAGSVKPEHLPRLIEIEERNLREATSAFERETARTRLQHFQTIAARLNLNGVPLEAVEEKKEKGNS